VLRDHNYLLWDLVVTLPYIAWIQVVRDILDAMHLVFLMWAGAEVLSPYLLRSHDVFRQVITIGIEAL
jgi:hypothetical protein